MNASRWELAARAATLLFLLSAAVLGWTLRRAFSPAASSAQVAAAPVAEIPPVAHRASYAPEVVLLAVEADPFDPARQRPRQRFRLPSERSAARAALLTGSAAVPATQAPVPYSPTVRLVGTMIGAGALPSAILEVAGQPARLVHLGERAGEYTLARVEPGRAVLVSARGDRTELRVARPGA